jgi:hypothetical protein
VTIPFSSTNSSYFILSLLASIFDLHFQLMVSDT